MKQTTGPGSSKKNTTLVYFKRQGKLSKQALVVDFL